ncbi:hypothetical protein [Asticcacaulis sp. 201]|uniref:hypothetical protein n=1 Tax=Asticcacaulis sp. 201 TaxID=3028787 RepID=UPI002915CE8C|nr:hypothetical protein [Asticcacaulis sp. 201]MDV6329933.1 hypothetical protein [Asticcacaulis sp. 201]
MKESINRLWHGLRALGWLGVVAVLIAPVIAMQFTAEVNWTASDFLFAGVLLIGGGALIELFAWRVRAPVIRIVFALIVVGAVATLWGAAID